MKTFKTSTYIVPIIGCGTYWGRFDYESMWLGDEEAERYEGNLVCNDYSFRKFTEALVSEADTVLTDERPLKDDGVVSIRPTAMLSPKEYNFSDDALDLTVEVEDDFLDRAEKIVFDPANAELFGEYIREHWCSRDGFISSMPARDLDEMRDVFAELRARPDGDELWDEYRLFGSVLALLWRLRCAEWDEEGCITEGYDYLTDRLYDRMRENHSLSEFCTILDREEAAEKFPEYGKLCEELDVFAEQIRESYRKYVEADVPSSSKDKAMRYRDGVLKIVKECGDKARSCVELGFPNVKYVKESLADLKEEWDAASERGWRELWA